jgi:hypothetical protein
MAGGTWRNSGGRKAAKAAVDGGIANGAGESAFETK